MTVGRPMMWKNFTDQNEFSSEFYSSHTHLPVYRVACMCSCHFILRKSLVLDCKHIGDGTKKTYGLAIERTQRQIQMGIFPRSNFVGPNCADFVSTVNFDCHFNRILSWIDFSIVSFAVKIIFIELQTVSFWKIDWAVGKCDIWPAVTANWRVLPTWSSMEITT